MPMPLTPVEIKRRQGNPGQRPLPEPINPDRVDVEDALAKLQPPDCLGADGVELWERIVPTLARVGILDGVDHAALEAVCTQWERAKAAGRVIDAQGMFARGSQGQLRAHPAVELERAAHMAYLKFAQDYALTPVARTRLGLAELKRKTMLEEMNDALGAPALRPADVEGSTEDAA